MLRNSLNLIQISSSNLLRQNARTLFTSVTNEAARKGTREKARQKKVKVEIKKVAFMPHTFRKKLKLDTANKHVDDSWKAIPKDDVYVGKYYQWRNFTVEEAILCHRETHHPTVYNVPNAPVIAHIELNMKGEKATKMVDNFYRMAPAIHKFDHGEERSVLVFAKGQENLEAARNAGAAHMGGVDLIKEVQNGDLLMTDYQYVVAHPNILPELVAIRGLMKKKFPNPKNGTLGPNIEELVQKFMNGIQYTAAKDEHQNDFGLILAPFGTLEMDPKHLEENLISLLKDVNSVRPKRAGKFVTRVLLKSPPSPEQLKINPFLYIPEGKEETKKSTAAVKKEVQDNEDDDAEDEQTAKAAN